MLNLSNDLELKEDAILQPESLNGNYPANMMSQIPCTIGFTYARFEVDGSVKPCCVSPNNIGNINNSTFDEVWHSTQYYTWRAKFLRIHLNKFHLKDKEFSFCQVCPHLPQNIKFIEDLQN